MALFELHRDAALPVGEVWLRLTDWERHAAALPLTRIVVTTPFPTHVGTRFVARTGIGPLAFDDPMDVVLWRPPAGGGPGRCRLEKRGRVVTGWAELEVSGRPGGGSRVVWREDLGVRGVPRPLDGWTARAGRFVFGRLVRRLLNQ
ncbi:SRPBCC family protein [Streptomyces griseocarneus]|uniref:SRPBCC family protein n=1 Tax=Streptomyces griseocarneus TaxID=51201 RepID=UPI00167DB5E8|nr:SRPBCC family protein [Streptomyces griseocarneus]MBZ6474936.1 SRPBCC family protein [Streptomyces griseocarneus]